MSHRYPDSRSLGRPARPTAAAGLTLAELLIAISIMVIVAGTLAALAKAVQSGAQYAQTQQLALQHGCVALERIVRTVREATANEQFPGVLVLAENVSPWRFPDTLVVWHPTSTARDPDGLPRFDELVIFCPNPQAPNELLEITVPGDARTVPAPSDTARWARDVAAIKAAPTSRKVVLTDRMRTAVVSPVSSTNPAAQRGVVWFAMRLRPSDAEWNNASIAWEQLPWVQGLYGAQTGLRQVWLRVELHVMPVGDGAQTDPQGQQAIPLWDSAAIYYPMRRSKRP